MIYTTLNRIRRHSPSDDVWRKLLTHLGKTAADFRALLAEKSTPSVGRSHRVAEGRR